MHRKKIFSWLFLLKQNWQKIMLFHAFMYEIEKCLVIFVCCTRSKRFIKLNDLEVKVCVILCQDLFKMTIYLTIVKVWLEKKWYVIWKKDKLCYISKNTGYRMAEGTLKFHDLLSGEWVNPEHQGNSKLYIFTKYFKFSRTWEDKGREFQKYFCSYSTPTFIYVPWSTNA